MNKWIALAWVGVSMNVVLVVLSASIILLGDKVSGIVAISISAISIFMLLKLVKSLKKSNHE